MPGGGIVRVQAANLTVEAPGQQPLQTGRYVHIAITDQGPGIPAEHLSRIFDPYFTTKDSGSGLGLATAYAVVTKHQGYITADSAVGVGTTLHIYLPAATSAVPVRQDTPTSPPSGQGKILVMDDEAAIREFVEEMLTSLGYEVVCVADGAEAMAAYYSAQVADQPFAAVLLDLTVAGGMGGQETLTRLRAIDPQVKAIVSSGYSDAPVMADFRQYGFSGMVPKPYTVASLSRALQRVLGGRRH
jgi:CheY-like chemotaxis protein